MNLKDIQKSIVPITAPIRDLESKHRTSLKTRRMRDFEFSTVRGSVMSSRHPKPALDQIYSEPDRIWWQPFAPGLPGAARCIRLWFLRFKTLPNTDSVGQRVSSPLQSRSQPPWTDIWKIGILEQFVILWCFRCLKSGPGLLLLRKPP